MTTHGPFLCHPPLLPLTNVSGLGHLPSKCLQPHSPLSEWHPWTQHGVGYASLNQGQARKRDEKAGTAAGFFSSEKIWLQLVGWLSLCK